MPRPRRAPALVALCAAALLAAACADRAEPARKALFEAQGALAMASEDGAKYAPEQLEAAERATSQLRKSYVDRDYAAVLAAAPAVIAATHAAAATAAERKSAAARAQNEEWARLANAVPALVAELHARKPPRPGAAADAAEARLRALSSQWSKAVAAFAAGNLEEAVRAGRSAETDGLALRAQR
jgi:hypothetical protein